MTLATRRVRPLRMPSGRRGSTPSPPYIPQGGEVLVHKTSEDRRNYQRNYQRRRYVERMHLAIDLLGGVCVGCGASREPFEFDHIDPSTKLKQITNMHLLSKSRFLDEVRKCQLLCHDCHAAKTHIEHVSKRRHGTSAMYKRGGCRCRPCTDAASEVQRVARAKSRERLRGAL